MAKDTVDKKVKMTEMLQPQTLTLTKSPANQIGFKVIRSADGKEQQVPHLKRTRVSRSEALLCITLEAGMTDEEVAAIADQYGLTDYQTTTDDSGVVSIRRADAPEGAETMTVKLGNGAKAEILKPARVQRGVAVTSIEFAKDYYETPEEAQAWLVKRGIDFDAARVQNGDLAISAVRQEVPEGTEVRQISVDDGVVFTVARSDTNAIPVGYVEVVSETAYGQWGWGQIDFAAALADIEYCRYTEQALRVLGDVIDRICFYSDLPLKLRKELLVRATGEFTDFVGTLLDALPTRVVVVSRSNLDKEKQMGTKEASAAATSTAVRSDAEVAAAAAAATPAATPAAAPAAGDSETVTRSEVASMITTAIGEKFSGVESKLDALTAALVQRSDAGAAAPATPEVKADPQAEAMQQVARSMQSVGDSVKALAERMDKFENSTAVRNDSTDGKQEASVKRSDPFIGIFGRKPTSAD